jgi:hypothetical protein
VAEWAATLQPECRCVSRLSSGRPLLGIGMTAAGRHLLIAFTRRAIGGQLFIRPISARFMHAKEIQHYEAQSQDSSEATSTEE